MTAVAIASSLRAVPMFAELSAGQLERLAESSSTHRLQAGEWLFHEGDAGDSLYVVTAGSLDAVAELPVPVVVRTLPRGQCIGELALLTGEPRSLGVRARRDCELARIGRPEFEALLLSEAGFGLGLTRVLGERLRGHRSSVETQAAPPRVVGLVPLHEGAPVAAVAAELAAAFEAMGRLARLDPAEPLPLETLDRLEADHDRVLLVATSAARDDPWTAYCLRQSDLVVGVASRAAGSAAGAPVAERLRGCDLAFLAPAGVEPDLGAWMDALVPRTTHILRTGSPAGARRMARRLAGRSLGVVLSGGGARGFAHIGVVEELQRAGYEVDRLGGASIGGIVGALFAEGRSAGEVMEVMEAEYVRTTPLKGRTIPLVALSRGVKGFAAQHRIHGGRCIEGLDVNFYCVSADLAAQRLVVHRRGLVAIAVSATQALPAFVPPVQDGDRLLIDGGVLNNLPVDPMLATGEGPVIAVDISGALPAPGPSRSRLPWMRRWIVGPAAAWAPPIAETVLRSILLGNALTDAAARERADVVIRPDLHGVSTMRFKDVEAIRQRGREAALAALAGGQLAAIHPSGSVMTSA
ncbi:MAG TPA: patatin-like phospholipase family protein [Candidatus Dormibacteraeota bacterium]|jgi:predicted acylesterase/phospholipase RssA/CRP-like cAMP-binding protein|nr:patatin-like phospholipase family protein [Candidatus Dormibacteraeota bacterium]